MGKFKVYKEQEPIQQKASESFVAYSKIDPSIATRERDNIKSAISGEELLDRLRPRIKALFKWKLHLHHEKVIFSSSIGNGIGYFSGIC